MAKLYCGTSGWAYASWKPRFYPAKLPAARFLQHYSSRLSSVEVNYTFRNLLDRDLARRWMDAAAPGFVFSIKAHQRFTHIKRLRSDKVFTRQFFASLQPLRENEKLGAVLFQLPPFLKCDAALLAGFLRALPSDYRIAFEFRHPSWFDEAVYSVLRKHRVALCIAESDELQTPDVQTAGFSYLRLRRSRYGPAPMEQLASRVSELLGSGMDVYAYFKHEESPIGAARAQKLLRTRSPFSVPDSQ